MSGYSNFVKISGIGSYVPDYILTNSDLSKMVDTSDEWIRNRTGIRERRIAPSGTSTSDLCCAAAVRAIENAGLETGDIDFILVGTISPDMIFPATAAVVQKKLGLDKCPCLDYSAACSSFHYGIQLAMGLLASEKVNHILLICGDKISSFVDWQDRATCVLFGDGAGAVVLSSTDNEEENCVLDVMTGASGKMCDILCVPAGGTSEPTSAETLAARKHFIKMSGRDIFREAVRTMSACVDEILIRNGMSIDDIDYFVPHQANLRIIEAVGEHANIPSNKVCVTVDKYGNTCASSCIIAIKSLVENGCMKKGMKILSVSFGAGLTWGASLLRW